MKIILTITICGAMIMATSSCYFDDAHAGASQVSAAENQFLDALRNDDVDRVSALIAAGTSADGVDQNGMSYLAHASASGAVDSMRVLLRAGADPWKTLPRGPYAVLPEVLVKKNDLKQLKIMLEEGLDPNTRLPESSVSLLHVASFDGWKEGVDLLLDHGADMSLHPDGFPSVADDAISGGNFDIVMHLIDRGYRHDLNGLYLSARTRDVDGEQLEQKKRLMRWLDRQGIKQSWPERPKE